MRLPAVLLAMVGASIAPRFSKAQVEETQARMREIRTAISEYTSTHGRLPRSLEEICAIGTPCTLMPMSNNRVGLLDAWGRPFVYSVPEGEYELRSVGPDGIAGTADDFVFRPSVERFRIRSIAGCYRADLSWWKEFPGTVLALDTVRAMGALVLKPVPEPFHGALWELGRRDSLQLHWVVGPSVSTIWLRQVGDSLVGTANIHGHRARSVVAYRTKCSENASQN